MTILTKIRYNYSRFDYYSDLVVIQNKKNVIILSAWFIGGVIADLLFSVIGFLTIGIEYEKNPIVVQSWQSNTFLDYLLVYALSSIISFLFFFEFLILLGVIILKMKKRPIKRLVLSVFGGSVGIPAYLVIEHYSQALSWIIAILLNKDGNTIFYYIFFLVNTLVCLLLLGRFVSYDYNLMEIDDK